MAEGEHQIDRPAAAQIQADLEIGLTNTAEQVGPVGQADPLIEAVGEHFLHRRQQLPGRGHLGGTGHLHLGVEMAGDGGHGRKGLELGCHAARNQYKNTHRSGGWKAAGGLIV